MKLLYCWASLTLNGVNTIANAWQMSSRDRVMPARVHHAARDIWPRAVARKR
jgi:hypothetical protein